VTFWSDERSLEGCVEQPREELFEAREHQASELATSWYVVDSPVQHQAPEGGRH
jgi:hypothetical protein